MTTTEKRVIGGLTQLTELLFKPHYKHNDNAEATVSQNVDSIQSDEESTSSENDANSTDMQTDMENGNCQQYLNNAMDNGQAEQFCGMIVRTLTTGSPIDHIEEWHRDQLDAYNLAHERLFERPN